MKTYTFKTIAAAVPMAAISSYFHALLFPIIALIVVMLVDYITGMTKAWMADGMSSKRGLKGIIKKLCYLILVVVGGAIDWIIQIGLTQAGIRVQFGDVIALIVIIWLIINELISILENLKEIGVPQVPGIDKLLDKVKTEAEKRANKMTGNKDDDNEKGS